MYVSDRAKYQGQITDEKRFMSREDYAQKINACSVRSKNRMLPSLKLSG
jgi:hypothetical protein